MIKKKRLGQANIYVNIFLMKYKNEMQKDKHFLTKKSYVYYTLLLHYIILVINKTGVFLFLKASLYAIYINAILVLSRGFFTVEPLLLSVNILPTSGFLSSSRLRKYPVNRTRIWRSSR